MQTTDGNQTCPNMSRHVTLQNATARCIANFIVKALQETFRTAHVTQALNQNQDSKIRTIARRKTMNTSPPPPPPPPSPKFTKFSELINFGQSSRNYAKRFRFYGNQPYFSPMTHRFLMRLRAPNLS